jgi:hypothetical protein
MSDVNKKLIRLLLANEALEREELERRVKTDPGDLRRLIEGASGGAPISSPPANFGAAPAYTPMTVLAATDPALFRERLRQYLPAFLAHVGLANLDPGAEVLDYLCAEGAKLQGRSVGAALNGWLRSFAEARGLAPARDLNDEDRKRIIEETVIADWANSPPPPEAPRGADRLRELARQSRIRTASALRLLDVPDDWGLADYERNHLLDYAEREADALEYAARLVQESYDVAA